EGLLAMLSERRQLIQGRIVMARAGTRVLEAGYGLGTLEPEGEDVFGRKTLVEQAFETGKVKLVPDIDREPSALGFAPPRTDLPPGKVSFIAVPIFENQTVLGVLVAFGCRHGWRSAIHDLDILRFAAAVIGQSLSVERRVAE